MDDENGHLMPQLKARIVAFARHPNIAMLVPCNTKLNIVLIVLTGSLSEGHCVGLGVN